MQPLPVGLVKSAMENVSGEQMEVDNGCEVEEVKDVVEEGKEDGNDENVEDQEDDYIEGEELDPYAYAKRDKTSSENFKIELRGLPNHYPVSQLKHLLNIMLQLNAKKVKVLGPKCDVVYVAFGNEEEVQKALLILDGYKWKGSEMSVQRALPAKDPLIQKKLEVLSKKKKRDEGLTIAEKITKYVTRYSMFDYEEQLKKKEEEGLQILRKFGKEFAQQNVELRKWVYFQKARRHGQVCEVGPIIPSPVKEHYRNKCEFTVGMNPETGLRQVGFRVSSYSEGSVDVGPVDHLRHLPPAMINVCQTFEKFVRDSPHEPFDPTTQKGVWRQLTVRLSNNSQILIIAVIHPQDLGTEGVDKLKEEIVRFFTAGAGKKAKVTSIFFQAYSRNKNTSGGDDCVEGETEGKAIHLWGETHLTETVLGKNFNVSAEAFLQVNTPCAEVLYNTVAEMADLDPGYVLLDICCGTGTIGISMADQVYRVYGIEMVDDAVEDAKKNAEINGLSNVLMFSGKAEDQIPNVLSHCSEFKAVAVVDPPRGGLDMRVIQCMRRNSNLKRFVYVACNPEVACKNFLQFTRQSSNQYRGVPFVPIKAAFVDMFPDTPHYEMVVLFERYDQNKWFKIMEGKPAPRDESYFKSLPMSDVDPDTLKEEEKRLREEDDAEMQSQATSTAPSKKRKKNKTEKYEKEYNRQMNYRSRQSYDYYDDSYYEQGAYGDSGGMDSYGYGAGGDDYSQGGWGNYGGYGGGNSGYGSGSANERRGGRQSRGRWFGQQSVASWGAAQQDYYDNSSSSYGYGGGWDDYYQGGNGGDGNGYNNQGYGNGQQYQY